MYADTAITRYPKQARYVISRLHRNKSAKRFTFLSSFILFPLLYILQQV